jgi:predicted DNA-binding protein (MmcQ/YjbR family)
VEHPPRKLNARYLARMRKICMAYPEVVEVEQFGNPWWKAGNKSFCIYGESDGHQGASFNLSLDEQALLLGDERFYKTGYIGRHGWTSMRFSGKIPWEQVEGLVEIAYRRVALKRMIKTLDETA